MPASLITGEAVTLDLRPAGIASRLLALLIDLVLMLVAFYIVILFALAAGSSSDALEAAVSVVAIVIVVLGYPVGMLVFNNGRTIGKLAMGLRVVRDDGGPVAFRQAFVRELAGIIDKLALTVLGALTMIFREDGKRIGDLLAGTMVVSDRVAPTGYVHTALIMPPQLATWAAGLDLSRLPDPVALRARELLGRMASLQPAAREQLGASITASVAAAVGPPPPGTPGWAYLSAVLAERHRREVLRLAGIRATAARRAAVLAPATASPRQRPVGMAAYDEEWQLS